MAIIRLPQVAGVCALVLGVTGFECHGSPLAPGGGSAGAVEAALTVTFSAPSEAQVGDSVPLYLSVKNRSSDTLGLALGGGGTAAFNPVVSDSVGSKVWVRDEVTGTVIFGSALDVRLHPGDSLVYQAVWPTNDLRGRPVRTGFYVITAALEDSRGESIIGKDHKVTVRVTPRLP